MSTFLIACGGTGGHLAPGIALAEGLVGAGHEACLLISNKDVDSRLVKSYPQLEFVRSPGCGMSWKPLGFLRFQWEQLRSFILAVRLIRRRKPAAIVGFGGFLSVGVTLAGFMLGYPVVLHEANRRPGRAIRMLSGLAQRIYLPEGTQLKSLPPQTVRHSGYPVRKEIRRLPQDVARQKLGIQVSGKLLLVFGGSQGAVALNKWVTENFDRLARENISVYCLTGLNHGTMGMVEHKLDDGQVACAYFVPFCDRMAEVLSAADLVVSRAGAGSIAEFIRCHTPSIIIPFPFAADDHQRANARFFEQQGGTIVVEQENISSLTDEVIDTIFNDWLLNKMRENLERLDRTSPIEPMIRDLESIAAERPGQPRPQQA
ncbi:UDP-N-acetylglucosamine--N-acetylmuramyl-(pentapeptide) pyrophosphoryl-undecaprenol N-acetylglucosamine transferase [Ruficoccus amylovorans]|uniref:UDP-N-acetylglucosamine--N-acetylmuramyl-(pentapeptide) pyrophosphoryl-undecaprenol N-acetylglucosamine transferase n=1 Tax=Ruficoccus amylovorans TaxID=1804625 RepID=A0A842HJN5_9BACT|nr:UDP-N-acetylglucosamine--N-acetylmuramyl-(pentapeptide) pyrophosphoryl-undecaprenol N-acetylglucosamine transferase [Ruficoccus amylovorans]MBC2595371.1 UDP-N-acetylglucosamine--N-acetylmuramyl-(pentapeptide) pyrophosphoryl-undecaprenol N-acetylglucosamine transferase [Ruficoccus amylovorans]